MSDVPFFVPWAALDMSRTSFTDNALAQLVNQAPEPIYVLDDRRTIIFCNDAVVEWTGTRAEDLIGARADYQVDVDRRSPLGVVSGLCPPPAAFSGQECTAQVSCVSADGRLLERAGLFVPLGRYAESQNANDTVSVVAFLAGHDSDGNCSIDVENGVLTADRLHAQISRFRHLQGDRYDLDHFIGESPAIVRVRRQIDVAARCQASVIILGSPGSGRSHLAKTLHYRNDSRKKSPLVHLSAPLIRADSLRRTLQLLSAESSADVVATLVLFEVDQLTEMVQGLLADWLAVLVPAVRVIATATTHLRELVEAGTYRDDLACLLSTITIELPALAERSEDIPLLAQVFLEESNRTGDKQIGSIAPQAVDMLVGYHWPAGIDELAEAVRIAHRDATGHQLQVHDLSSRLRQASQAAAFPNPHDLSINLSNVLQRVETDLIGQALSRTKGNKAQAARLLGLTRPKLYRRMDQLGLTPSESDFHNQQSD